MKRTGWEMVLRERRDWSSSQFVRRWRYQFTVLLALGETCGICFGGFYFWGFFFVEGDTYE